MLTEATKDAMDIALASRDAKNELVAMLDMPVADMIAVGTFTTLGGDVTESITVSGMLATDNVIVAIAAVGAAPVTVLTAIAAADAITVTMSADPSTDHVLTYMVMRTR